MYTLQTPVATRSRAHADAASRHHQTRRFAKPADFGRLPPRAARASRAAHGGLSDPPPRSGTPGPTQWAPPHRLAPSRAPPPAPQRLLRLLHHPPRTRPGRHAPAARARPPRPRRVGPEVPGPTCCRSRRCSEGSAASCDEVRHLSGGMDLQRGRTGPAVSVSVQRRGWASARCACAWRGRMMAECGSRAFESAAHLMATVASSPPLSASPGPRCQLLRRRRRAEPSGPLHARHGGSPWPARRRRAPISVRPAAARAAETSNCVSDTLRTY